MNSKDLGLEEIGRRALHSAAALAVRQISVQGLNVFGAVILAHLLTPAEFGLYAIITFFLAFLSAFGGTGLAANLIRQPSEPTDYDYQAAFTFQQMIVLSLAILIWLLAPWIVQVYQLRSQETWLFRSVALSLIFTSFMVIPQVQLERQLAFSRLALIEVFQALVFNLTAVLVAWKGEGTSSFALAILLRSITGAILANLINPWAIGLRFRFTQAWHNLRFGFYYQGGQFINLAKDSIYVFFIGVTAGASAVGFINLAGLIANSPVILVMLLNRLYMPMFARLLGDQHALKKAVQAILAVLCGVIYPVSALIFVFREEIILLFGDKWLPAMGLFPPLLLINFLLAPTLVVIGLLNAIDRAEIVFRLMMVWAVSTWLLGPWLVSVWGWQAWPWANLLVNSTSLTIWYVASRHTGLDWWATLSRPLGLTALTLGFSVALTGLQLPWMLSVLLSTFGFSVAWFTVMRPEILMIRRLLR